MDFARKQLEKYGWTDGKGLGKHEDGISKALKPKLKRSVTGVGHDAAAEFNDHWWSSLYDKAAKNVEVEEKNGNIKRINAKDSDHFQITNNTWKLNSKHKNDKQYKEYFVRTEVLSGGSRTENVKSGSESETDDSNSKIQTQLTDEELFKACRGRTAHKGARHGLRATGKLARIEQQEKLLLTQPKYQGYSHAKKLKQTENIVEDLALTTEVISERKKKKKKKRCTSLNTVDQSAERMPENNLNLMDVDCHEEEKPTNLVENIKRKSKKKLKDSNMENSDDCVVKNKKKKRHMD